MKKIVIICICVIICFLTGFISSRLQTSSINTWYPFLHKSSLTPPNYIFPVAWSILYLCMGISIGLLVSHTHSQKKFLFLVFVIQLFLNFLWSITFFYLQNPLLAMFIIILLDMCIIFYAIKAYPILKISSLLFIPYIAWVSFAAYLNLYIVIYN